MEDNASGAQQNQTSTTSGASNDTQATSQQTDTRVIKPEDHERAINDMMKFKKALGEKDLEISNLRKEFETFKKKNMEAGQDFKGLYELERGEKEAAKKEALEAKESSDKLKRLVAYNEKFRAIQKSLLEKGFKQEALSLLESESFDNVELEITSKGNFNVLGVDSFVESYKKKYNFLFGNNQTTVVNSGGGSTVDEEKPLTHQYMVELSRSRKPEDQVMLKKLWPKYVQQQSLQKNNTK